MSFSRSVADMDARVARRFTRQDPEGNPINAVFRYRTDKSSSNPVSVVVKNPIMEEDYVPGSSVPPGVLILWFRSSDVDGNPIRQPVNGDVTSYGPGDYDINRVAVDREGGVTVYTRLRSQRWDQ